MDEELLPLERKNVTGFKALAPKKLNYDEKADGSNKENEPNIQTPCSNMPELNKAKSGKKPRVPPVSARVKQIQSTKSV